MGKKKKRGVWNNTLLSTAMSEREREREPKDVNVKRDKGNEMGC